MALPGVAPLRDGYRWALPTIGRVRGRAWIFAIAFAWLAIATIPTAPVVLTPGIDGSWRRALSLAYDQNLMFGKDINFTFGPLGYLLFPIPGLIDPIPGFMAVWGVYGLYLLGALLIWRSLGHCSIVFVSWLVLGGAMLLLQEPSDRMQVSYLSLLIGILALFRRKSRFPFAYLAVAGVLAGVMMAVKTNEGSAGWATFYVVLAALLATTSEERRRIWRKVLLLVVIPPVAFLAAFAIAEENVVFFWPYVTRAVQMARGYSEAMALEGPPYQTLVGVFSLLALGLIIPLLASARRDLIPGLLPALVAGFFAFKLAIVRQDIWHAPNFPVKFAVIGLLVLICARTLRDRYMLSGCILASFCYGVVVLSEASPQVFSRALTRASLQDAGDLLEDQLDFPRTWERLALENAKQLAELHVDGEVAAAVGTGTADAVPWDIDMVLANSWRWHPRPVIQSYAAYAPPLDQLNATHLSSPNSADHILLQWESIDHKSPLLDDAASWRALFDHYDLQLTRPNFLLLKRRDAPRYLDPKPLGSVATTWEAELDIPRAETGELIMMRAEINKNLYGNLVGVFFRNAGTTAEVTYASGAVRSYRATRANLVDGAFVTYLPVDLEGVLPYLGKDSNTSRGRVASIRFTTLRPAEFSPEIRVSWYRVELRK